MLEDATTTTNLTFNSNTSTIKYIDSSSTGKTFIGGGLTYYMLEEATGSTGALTITGSNTFQGIYINGSSRTLKFTAGTTTTFTSGGTGITTTGTGLTITSATSATHTLTKSSGTVTVQNTTISYSTAQGGAIWDSLVSANNVDGGNNSGWRFGINVSGTANGNNGAVVKVAINGTVQAQTATISGGAWTISNMTIPTTNDIVTVWIDGVVSDANESTGVTKWSAGI
jgi:hypothetical protein